MTEGDRLMRLTILVPSQVFLECADVKRIVAETSSGFFGIWPRRLDCVAPLVPGIFSYETRSEGERYVATDEGILVKAGFDVTLVVRNAIGAAGLGQVRTIVEREILRLNELESAMRSVLVKLESSFVRRFMGVRHERST